MKIISQLALRCALLALLALGLSSLTAKAQTTMFEVTDNPRAEIKKVKLVADSLSPAEAHDDALAVAAAPEKYLLHVSDRAQRGQMPPAEARAPSVLPELSASEPAELRSKFTEIRREPKSGE